jgi:hypothetical protein
MFDVLAATNWYAFIHRTVTAVRPETHARRIAWFIDLLAWRRGALRAEAPAAVRTATSGRAPRLWRETFVVRP